MSFLDSLTDYGKRSLVVILATSVFAAVAHYTLPGMVPVVYVIGICGLVRANMLTSPDVTDRASTEPIPDELARYEEDFK